MNTKNIILAILMVLSFTACSSEIEEIDNNMTNTTVNNNGVTSISVRMTTSNMNTKSAGQETLAATDENVINNYIIAIFEHGSKQRIGYAKGRNSTAGGEVTSFVFNVASKEGLVDVYVVANLNEQDEAKFEAIYYSDDFVIQTVGSLDRLVKVGSAIEQEISSEKNKVSVVLSQLTARVKVNVKETASVNGDSSGDGPVKATIKANSYSAKVEYTSKLFNPDGGKGENPGEAIALGNNNFHFVTYRLNNPELQLNVAIAVFDGKTTTTINREITVPFKTQNTPLDVLENGKSYELTIEAALSVSVDCDVTLSYQLHEIEDIKQDDIVFD